MSSIGAWPGAKQGRPATDLNPDAHPYRLRGSGDKPGWSHQMLVSNPPTYGGIRTQCDILASAGWDVVPPEGATLSELSQTEHIRRGYADCDGGLVTAGVIRMMSAILHGFALSEMVIAIDEDGLWQLAGLHWIAPWSVKGWVVDAQGHWVGITQFDLRGRQFPSWSVGVEDGIYIPREDLYHYAIFDWGRNPEGIGTCRPLYYNWQHKRQILVDDADARARASSGVVYGHAPEGVTRESKPQEWDEVERTVYRIASGGDDVPYYLAPDGWQIGVNYLQGMPDATAMLRYHDHQDADLHADTISDLGQTGYGARAVGGEMRIERASALAGQAQLISQALDQQVTRRIYELNGWDYHRSCKVKASGLVHDQMVMRRLLEFLTTPLPEGEAVIETTDTKRRQIERAFGLGV